MREAFCNTKPSHIFSTKNIGVFEILILYLTFFVENMREAFAMQCNAKASHIFSTKKNWGI